MKGIFQHHSKFHQQNGIIWIHRELVGDGFRLAAHIVIAQPDHLALSRREERQQVIRVRIRSLPGNQGVPSCSDTCPLKRITG